MRILFVYSGNKPEGIGRPVKSQADSLSRIGVDISFFPIFGKGISGYIKNIFLLKKQLNKGNYNVIHAHYAYSGFVASLAGARALVVSLMGSDVNGSRFNKIIIRFFYSFFGWRSVIVKSSNLGEQSRLKHYEVIPNGVDTGLFKPMDKKYCMDKLGWSSSTKNILFAANPSRSEKNFPMAEIAIKKMKDSSLTLRVLGDITHQEMPVFYNAADLILLTSRWEGSPNVVKEAMACNRPVVITDVGDVRKLFKDVEGCFIADHDIDDVANKIRLALDFGDSSNGRRKIIWEGLDSVNIANKIKHLYLSIMEDTKDK